MPKRRKGLPPPYLGGTQAIFGRHEPYVWAWPPPCGDDKDAGRPHASSAWVTAELFLSKHEPFFQKQVDDGFLDETARLRIE